MESTELTELQFEIIKLLCKNRILLVSVLHSVESDTPEVKKRLSENSESLKALERAGFLENRNENMKESLEFLRRTGQTTFDMYALTELAYKMFNPDEGVLN